MATNQTPAAVLPNNVLLDIKSRKSAPRAKDLRRGGRILVRTWGAWRKDGLRAATVNYVNPKSGWVNYTVDAHEGARLPSLPESRRFKMCFKMTKDKTPKLCKVIWA